MHERVLKIIFSVVDEINLQRPKFPPIRKEENSVFLLDSLGLVNFIALAEEEFEKEFRVSLNLLESNLFLSDNGSVRSHTLGSLTQSIQNLIEREKNG